MARQKPVSAQPMRYRLALDLGSTSLGWAMIRLKTEGDNEVPCAVIKAGVRIFSDGRNPKDGSSLAVTRREARAMRRRRDRLLKRKARMMDTLVKYGFFPKDDAQRKALETLNPYALRAKGLDEALKPEEFARALFHINQRRGFKSNRKTDKGASDSAPMKKAISALQQAMTAFPTGANKRPLPQTEFDWFKWVARELPETQSAKPRTVGEFLYERFTDTTISPDQRRVRARNNGLKGGKLVYDLYIDRGMIEAEFEALWARQAKENPTKFSEAAYGALKDRLLFQRNLRPVKPGRCTFEPDEPRAPLALPSQQRFRMYQEVNNLYILSDVEPAKSLTLDQRDQIIAMLERPTKEKKTAHEVSFDQIRVALRLGVSTKFNLQDAKRNSLKGNSTSASLSKQSHFGAAWFTWSVRQQDAIVRQLTNQENMTRLVKRLVKYCAVDEKVAERIADAGLPDGYGSLSRKALAKLLPKLCEAVVSVAAAAKDVGYKPDERGEVPGRTFPLEHVVRSTGEIKKLHVFHRLPYYGEFLSRHVGFAKENPTNVEERFGKIANPTVHIGLNQARTVVNALIERYGHPSEVIVEVANELKRPSDHRPLGFRIGKITTDSMRRYCPCAGCVNVRQAVNQDKNKELRAKAFKVLERPPKAYDIEKMRLWNEMLEMNGGIVQCPYSGTPLSLNKVLSAEVEIDHIFPHQKTLDDSLANKVLCVREANRIKTDRSPAQAKDDFLRLKGWRYEEILARVANWDRSKRFRFQEGAFEEWLGESNSFLPRALNDTRYLSRIAREYLSLICPQDTRVIPGQMTALIRKTLGLNNLLDPNGEKNRNDHRHHAVDACVIAMTDQGMLQRFANASASARKNGMDHLLDTIHPPWPKFKEQVTHAINNIWVSHKPDHGYETEIFDGTIYNSQGFSRRAAKLRSVVPFGARVGSPGEARHGHVAGKVKPYKGLLSNSNYCIEIVRATDAWEGHVIPTYKAYEFAREFEKRNPRCSGIEILRNLRSPATSISGAPLVMRLSIGDAVRVNIDGVIETLHVLKIGSSGSITFVRPNEANVPNRYSAKLKAQKLAADGKEFDFAAKHDDFFQQAISTSSLKLMEARRVTISPIGELRDPGFKG